MTAVALPGPYRRVLAASTLSNLSDGIRLAAFPLLAYSLTPEPFLIGLVATAGLVPGPLFGLWAGWLSDRCDRRLLVKRVNALRSVLLVGLAVFIIGGWTTIPLLMLSAFVLGVSEIVADNSLSSLIPSLVEPAQLERANSRMVASEILGNEFFGPAIGAALFGVGMAVPFISNAGLLGASVLFLAGLSAVESATGELDGSTDSGRVREGLAYLLQSHPLRVITMASSLLIAIDGAWFALVVVLTREVLGLPDHAFGLLLACGAFGGLAGSVIADRFAELSLRHVTVGVFATMAISLLGLALHPTATITLVALVATSGAFAVWNVFAVSARQRLTPIHLLGRVTGAYKTLVLGAAVIGTSIGALVAQVTSIETTLLLAGTLAAVSTPFLWFAVNDAGRDIPSS